MVTTGNPRGQRDRSKAHAFPTKDFFVRMITRDIKLADCIMDLVDNSIDGAHRVSKRSGNLNGLAGYMVEISIGGDGLVVDDNCGGISLDDAIDYAFHFGRKKDAPDDVDHPIGLYGIGMKRAIFKIGKQALIESRPDGEAFKVKVDVAEWSAKDEKDWDFEIESLAASQARGTRVAIAAPYDAIAATFVDQSFVNGLIRTMARDYAFVLAKGFRIFVNKVPVPSYQFQVKEGGEITPAVRLYEDDGVEVRIVAGLMKELSDDIPEELRPGESEPFGWYVVCNDRVVVAGNKDETTVWGRPDTPNWHPQYNGFGGFLFLWSDDPKKLPWTTTKRSVEVGDPLYMRATAHMREITKVFIAYTNQRKQDPVSARDAEMQAASVSVSSVAPTSAKMRLPNVSGGATSGPQEVSINYRKPKAEVREAAEALGNFNMSNREVGVKTFEYFRRNELGKP